MRRKEKLAEEERMSKLRALLGDWRNEKKDGDDESRLGKATKEKKNKRKDFKKR